MHGNKLNLTLVLLATIFILVACVMPASTPPPATEIPPTEPGAKMVYTAAAETMQAQLTPQATELPLLTLDTLIPPTGEASVTPVVINPPTPEPNATALEPISVSPGAQSGPTEQLIAPTATVRPVATYPVSDLGAPTWHDPLSSGENWPLYEDTHARFTFKDNKLNLMAKNLDWWDSWMLTRKVLNNFYLEANFKTGKCSGYDRYGLMFRQGYLFGVSCDGTYSLKKWDGSQSVVIKDWTVANSINKGAEQTNRLRVKVVGDKFSLYVNGNLLGEFTDASYSQGQFGFFVGAKDTPNFEVSVDQIAYWEQP